MEQQEQKLRAEYQELQEKLQAPDIYASKDYPALAKRASQLEETIGLFDDLAKIKKHEAEAQTMVESGGELSELAGEELGDLRVQRLAAEQALTEALLPKDPNDERNAVVEIRAAAGGDE